MAAWTPERVAPPFTVCQNAADNSAGGRCSVRSGSGRGASPDHWYVNQHYQYWSDAPSARILGIVERRGERPVRVPKSVSRERRSATRFALNLKVRFTVSKRHAHVTKGSGRTIDLSSSGLSLTTNQPLLPGQKHDVSIDWPVLLDGAIKLQLVMSGVVVRADTRMIALRIKRHEFRTRRVGLDAELLQESVG